MNCSGPSRRSSGRRCRRLAGCATAKWPGSSAPASTGRRWPRASRRRRSAQTATASTPSWRPATQLRRCQPATFGCGRRPGRTLADRMKNGFAPGRIALLVVAGALAAPLRARAGDPAEAARWEREEQAVTIVRDDWGIAHVYGGTDADAVFGTIYAQAEDDFNRVETNYLNAMG